MSWSGMGSLALPLWYTLHAEGEGGVLCLRKDPRAPSHPQPFGTNVPVPRGGAVLVPLLSTAPHLCNKRSILCPSPVLGQGCSALACLGEKELLFSPFPEVTGSLPLHFLTVN